MTTLEPIEPAETSPYGAIIIGNDVVCTPTSLCAWTEDKEPVVYCRKPAHTLNPVCKKTNLGIGLVDCYSEKTCGGIVRPGTTEKILGEKPHYITIIREEERRQRQAHFRFDYAWAVILVLMVVLLMILLGVGYKARKRRARKKKLKLNRSPRR